MKIKVDEEKCIGCGSCAAMYPDNFEMNEENKAKIVNSEISDDDGEMSVNICPVTAIEKE